MTQWVRFTINQSGATGSGIVENGQVVEYGGDPYSSPVPTGQTFSLEEVALLSPCVPSKVVALWNNFYELSAKLGKAPPSHPLFLIKPASSLAGPNDPIVRPKSYSGKIAYEGELGIVIGKKCTNVSVEDAPGFIFGYTCVNDVTAMEVLNEDANFPQWCRSKGFDTFSCIGPVITTDLDWKDARVSTKIDGKERQNYPLADMIFSPAEQVSLVSHDMTLLPGDVIACGTSVGIGVIRDGATVEVSIPGIGALSNRLTAP